MSHISKAHLILQQSPQQKLVNILLQELQVSLTKILLQILLDTGSNWEFFYYIGIHNDNDMTMLHFLQCV